MLAVRVIIIDDSITVRKIFVKALTALGCDVVGEASDGVEGVDLFTSAIPDVVFMDVEMSNMNGIDALIQMRAIKSDTCVVMLSGSDSSEVVSRCKSEGAAKFVRKDLGLGHLKDQLASVLQSV